MTLPTERYRGKFFEETELIPKSNDANPNIQEFKMLNRIDPKNSKKDDIEESKNQKKQN